MGTVHANSPEDAIVRLEALAQGAGAGVSERALRLQVASAIDIIIQVSRYSDGSRRIGAISEIRGFDDQGNYNVVPIFQMSRLTRKPDGSLEGRLEPTGELPLFMEEIIDNNLPFPKSKFQKKAA
jgi:pilus assembly protein CpaF